MKTEQQARKAPHPDRYRFVAERISPLKTMVGAEKIVGQGNGVEGVAVRLDCGHYTVCAPHFSYSVGGRMRCIECGFELASKLPEFNFFDASDLQTKTKCLRNKNDEGMQGPCSAGQCQWPNCKPDNNH